MTTFAVKNFEKFQHYKDRSPPWIRLYNSVLDDYEFGRLPDASKAHLLAIWLLASRYENKIPYDAEWVSRRINATEEVDLDALEKSGFIVVEQGCSETLAPRKQLDAPEESRGETETDTSSLRSDVRAQGPETEMLDAYNEAARQVGWPTAGKLTQPRKTSLARIAGDIGAEGWRNAMARARASPFLTGKAGRRDGHENWRPDLDFFLRPKTLTKLLEGSYDGAPGGGRQAADRPHDTVFRALASVVEKRARNGGGAADPHGRPDDDGGAEEADILLPPSHHRQAFSAAR